MKFFLEITPAIVNKTAIHNIIKDSIDAIPECTTHLLTMGKTYRYSGEFGHGMPKLLRLAIKFPRLFILARKLFLPFLGTDTRPIFFFDPLYLLFYKRLQTSKVLILDLTPLTHPYWHNASVSLLYQQAFLEVGQSNIQCHSISKSTQSELKRIIGVPDSHNHLLYIYAHNKYKMRQTPTLSKQVLFVGSFEPRKNLIGLINGFLKSKLPSQGYRLNIVGAKTAHYESVNENIASEKSIQLHGYLSDSELMDVYQNTQIFAYPSHWEGFGVPLLESIQMNIASFASKTGASPEVGGPDMNYVDPTNELEIAQTLEYLSNLTTEQYLSYTQKIRNHAQMFSFEKYIQTLRNELGY